MATGLEAAATVFGIVGFSAQVFDGCIKGFVLLSSAHNLGRDADMFRCMLDWEQFRLEQWAEKAGLQDKEKADSSLDWKLISTTLEHIQTLTNDTNLLREKYKLVLVQPSSSKQSSGIDDAEKASVSRFKKLFGHSDQRVSSATAKVIQSRNSPLQKLWWAAVDKASLKRLTDDISHLTQRLYDSLNLSIQSQMKAAVDELLREAVYRSDTALEYEVLEQLGPVPEKPKQGETIEEQIQRNRPLYPAIRNGNSEKVEFLLDKGGADIEGRDFCGWSPLIRAAEEGKLAVVELLLKKGANPLNGTLGHLMGRMPLHFAAEEGHEEVVKLLLTLKDVSPNLEDNRNETALFKAARSGKLGVVRLLLGQDGIKADSTSKDGWTPLTTAVVKQHSEIVRALLAMPEVNPNAMSLEQAPLWMAAATRLDIVQQLLGRPDININQKSRRGETAFYRAITWSQIPIAQLLLDNQADPNIADEAGRTPLSVVAAKSNDRSMEFLLALPNLVIDQFDQSSQTALVHAILTGETNNMRLLLTKGADLEKVNQEGNTALGLAAAKGHKVMVKVLLKHGAKINVQDKKGNTPLALAVENGHDPVVRLLLENGADTEVADVDEETPFEKARDRHLDLVLKMFRDVLTV
ncbi:Ankyrin repeat domain-containing protein 44 [Toensbergia leucococca]|nr:Ankyrin repeat domain-containing protein 44 [Toensbergia leucococca]